MSSKSASGDALVVALDLGTSSVRAMLFDRRGRPFPLESSIEVQHKYQQTTTADGGVETDPDRLVDATVGCVQGLVRRCDPAMRRRIAAVGTSCFWHSLVGVDNSGRAVTPLYSWSDTRAARTACELAKSLEPAAYHARTGCEIHPSFWPAKLLWVKAEGREVFGSVKTWMGFGEYLMLRLFGSAAVSVSMASGTGLYDPNRCDWDAQTLAALPIEPENLNPVVDRDEGQSGAVAAYRRKLGPLAGVPWFPAVGDGACSNVGSGALDRHRIALNIGTSAAMRMAHTAARYDVQPGLFCYRIDRKRFLIGGAFSSGGNVYAWLEETLRLGAPDTQRRLAAMQPASHGLTVLPFWAGERSPGWHGDARAVVEGMRLHTCAADILRASLEAEALLYDSVRRRLAGVADPEAEIVASGGAITNDPVWCRILADVFGMPVWLSKVGEASSRGAALMALESAGAIQSIDDAPFLRGRVFHPDSAHRAAYDAARERYEALYEKMVATEQ